MPDVTIKTDNYKGLTEDLKNSLWSVAILDAPYRTGNLRSAIKRISSSKNKVVYAYSDQQAYYTDFLENGIGRVKRHQGFIEHQTVGDMVLEIINYAVSGETTFKGIPIIDLRTDKARNYERKMLKKQGISANSRINAVDRAFLSMIQYNKNKPKKNRYKSEFGKFKGDIQSPLTSNLDEQKRSSRFGSNNVKGGK